MVRKLLTISSCQISVCILRMILWLENKLISCMAMFFLPCYAPSISVCRQLFIETPHVSSIVYEFWSLIIYPTATVANFFPKAIQPMVFRCFTSINIEFKRLISSILFKTICLIMVPFIQYWYVCSKLIDIYLHLLKNKHIALTVIPELYSCLRQYR